MIFSVYNHTEIIYKDDNYNNFKYTLNKSILF